LLINLIKKLLLIEITVEVVLSFFILDEKKAVGWNPLDKVQIFKKDEAKKFVQKHYKTVDVGNSKRDYFITLNDIMKSNLLHKRNKNKR